MLLVNGGFQVRRIHRRGNMKNRLPEIKPDAQAEELLAMDLTDYLHRNNFKPAQLELLPKTAKGSGTAS